MKEYTEYDMIHFAGIYAGRFLGSVGIGRKEFNEYIKNRPDPYTVLEEWKLDKLQKN